MYRAPKATSGGHGFLLVVILLWGAFYLAGCDTPTEPADEPFAAVDQDDPDLASETDLTLVISADSELAAFAVAEVPVPVIRGGGDPRGGRD